MCGCPWAMINQRKQLLYYLHAVCTFLKVKHLKILQGFPIEFVVPKISIITFIETNICVDLMGACCPGY